ncbi:MAG: L-arabinose transport system permease protein AraQ [Chloroflexi bacterium ADurb.Bin325]|nr:MAG: L-arabinose transport system permease protein AraQ [Chloroflexi bacterium ADurb.Bin325]
MRKTLKHDFPLHVFLGIAALLTFYPFIFLVISSFRSTADFMHSFWGLPNPLVLANYRDAWSRVSGYVGNSVLISVSSMVGVLFIGSISAFVFARYNFPGKEIFFFGILALLMIPGILTLVPAFLLIKSFGLLNTYWALILPYIAGGQIFGIFVLRSFIASLPEELYESARLDGASMWHLYAKITVPLSKPILVTIAIMNILSTWNDYIWPLVTIPDGNKWTVSVGIVSFGSSFAGSQNYGPMFAGYVIASLPLIILFMFTMRYFIAGLTSGAIKA